MWQIFYSALAAGLNWFVRSGGIKLAVCGVLTWLMGLLLSMVGTFVPALDPRPYIAQMPSGMLYFVGYFKVPECTTIILGAYMARFLIRRLPVIG